MTERWWHRLPQRVFDENARLRELVTDGTIAAYAWRKQETGELWLTADLRLGLRSQTVEIRFPDRYPGECPALRPIPYGTRLSSHQFGGDGVLCLELGPDNWHSRFMAVDLLRSAWKLLALELINTVESIPIPSRHVETLGITARHKFVRVIISREALRALEASEPPVEFEYTVFSEDAAIVLWVTHVPSGTTVPHLPPRITGRDRQSGLAVRCSADTLPLPTDILEFREFLKAAGVQPDRAAKAAGLVLLTTTGNLLARYLPSDPTSRAWNVAVIPVDVGGTGAARLGNMPADIEAARIAIVGLGSLGSKIATSLARSGITNVALVDGDVFLPQNVVRHDADYTHVGLMKTEAARARMLDVGAESISVAEFQHDIADGSNPAVHAGTVEALAGADLIIDATANPDAFNFIADLASEERRPLAWGEIFAGGLGGYAAYAMPGATPCPSCVRAAFLAHAAEWPPAPQGGEQPYGRVGSDGPIVATDADVTVIAGALAALALRLLARDMDGCAPVTLIGLRRGWIFDRAFETREVRVRIDDFSCPRCWSRPTAPDAALLAQVGELLNTPADAENPSQP